MTRRLINIGFVFSLFLLINQLPALAQPLPEKILDLSTWKLTLPTDSQQSGRADEIKFPKLKTYQHSRYFFTKQNGDGVVFRAPCGGATTKGSKYPRSELREMTKGGQNRASWSTDDKTFHQMTVKLAITHTPSKKKHVVCAQIHDKTDDVLMVRLEGNKLFIERNSLKEISLNDHYKLGTPFKIKIKAGQGKIKLWYNDKQKMDWKKSSDDCYFKAGCYTQSSTKRGDAAEAYGEVLIYKLALEHGSNL